MFFKTQAQKNAERNARIQTFKNLVTERGKQVNRAIILRNNAMKRGNRTLANKYQRDRNNARKALANAINILRRAMNRN